MKRKTRAGVKLEGVFWAVHGSPTEWVLSVNLHRRHLTQGQKAAVATESLPLFEAEAAQKKKETQGRPSKLEERIPQESREPQARDKAAAAVGVNPRYVSDAKKIKEESPEVFEKVKAGEITIPQAKSIIRPIPEPQLSTAEQKVIEAAEGRARSRSPIPKESGPNHAQ